ncbi:MAG: flagellar basal-body MS-ring/collar protein FliF [Syntrophomonadaceae bacterium]|nr:flagellar basal-body MS-ring/collar protein FliF [Syntrophomonadaceae bacterium]
MMETFVNNVRQTGVRIKEAWTNLSLNQKVLFGAAALLIITAVVILALSTGSKTAYEVLYTELDKKDASAIIAKLDEEKIAYKLGDSGTTILVSPEVKDKTRLQLASENLPRGETGFELFQESNFGETQTDKKVKYQMALQGELARSIQSLDKVKAAKVNLALPEPTLYSDNEELPKASVVVNTKEGEKLSPKEIQGIINLVANSVENLTAENVVIVDQGGNLISDNLPDPEGDATAIMRIQMDMKKQFEKEKQEAIQSMLDKSLGKDNSVVRVNADLNFDNQEQTDEKYTHDDKGPFVRSEEIKKESGTDTTTNNAAVPGTDTNIPQYQEADTNGTGNSSYDKSSKIRNYELNKTETSTKMAQGEVKYDYLTVAVLVNNKGTENANIGETEEAKVEKIRNIVATACGLRENRDNESVRLEDNISVAFVDFVTEPVPASAQGTMDKVLQSPLTPWIIALLALLIGLLAGFLMKRRQAAMLAKQKAEEEAMAAFESIVEEEIRVEDLIDAGLSAEEKEKRRIKEEIERIINEHPETAAQALRVWLGDE